MWQKHGVVSVNERKPTDRRKPAPLDRAALEALALHYVGRYATSRARLDRYLRRKIAERGWEGEEAADPAAIIERMVALGYVNDALFAESRARALTQAGYGRRRVEAALYADRIAEDDRVEADALTDEGRVAAALRFARRRRCGPYAGALLDDPDQRRRLLGAFARAGHDLALARAILALAPGAATDELEG